MIYRISGPFWESYHYVLMSVRPRLTLVRQKDSGGARLMMTCPQLCSTNLQIRTGVYRHYKGGLYEVLSIATHSESQESLVIYRSLSVGQIWARPCSMFTEDVCVEGNVVPRFEWVEPVSRRSRTRRGACPLIGGVGGSRA